MDGLSSLEGVVDVAVYEPKGAPRGWLVVEVPHGATDKAHYDAVFARLKSPLPEQLEHFFFVNTDIGAPEGAAVLGQELSARGVGVVVARCLIPRTFIDTNRVIDLAAQGQVVKGLTPGLASYVTHQDDVAWLTARHAEYHRVVAAAYLAVCGKRNGLALQLHSFSPRSVSIEKTDENIVKALHAAYVPLVYAKWPERPQVDCISATEDGSFKSAPKLVAAAREAYREVGVDAKENATYSLHPSTMGLFYARAWPERVLCLEWNRGLVADPFVPFGVSPISAQKVARLTAPLVKVFDAAFAVPR